MVSVMTTVAMPLRMRMMKATIISPNDQPNGIFTVEPRNCCPKMMTPMRDITPVTLQGTSRFYRGVKQINTWIV